MRKLFTPATLAFTSLGLGALFASVAGAAPERGPYNLILQGSLPDATLLSVNVEGLDKEAGPIELTMVEGRLQNGISIPAAKGRYIVLRAENADGKVLYEGAMKVDVGTNYTPQVSLEMKSAMDGAPGKLTLASHRVALEFAAIERDGKPFTQLTGNVFDANGLRLQVKPDDFKWRIDDPEYFEGFTPCPIVSGAPPLCVIFEPLQPTRFSVEACIWNICTGQPAPPTPRVWDKITVGLRHHACVLKADHSAYCWGQGEMGQLGSIVPKDCVNHTGMGGPMGQPWGCSAFPVPLVCPNGPCQFTDISAGTEHTCAVDVNQDAWCWGANTFGELGVGSRSAGTEVPTRVSTPYKFTAIRAADGMTCGLTTLSQVACWGENALSIVPASTSQFVLTPEIVPIPTKSYVTAIDASFTHACAQTASGLLFCWGSNLELKLGSSQFVTAPNCTICPAVPRLMQTAGISDLVMKRVSLVVAGANGSCAHLTNAETVCWGRGMPRMNPGPVERLARGESGYCAIGGGVLGCAGNGPLGDGLDINNGTSIGRGPVSMAGKYRDYREVDMGFNSTCAIAFDEQVYCWGHNSFGGLGMGFNQPGAPAVLVPTALSFP